MQGESTAMGGQATTRFVPAFDLAEDGEASLDMRGEAMPQKEVDYDADGLGSRCVMASRVRVTYRGANARVDAYDQPQRQLSFSNRDLMIRIEGGVKGPVPRSIDGLNID